MNHCVRIQTLWIKLGVLIGMAGMPTLLIAQTSQPSPFDDLLDGIASEPAAAGETTVPLDGSPLATAYQAMLRAQQQLQQDDAVDAAMDAQQAAIDALDSLLQQLQQPPPSSESSSSESPPEPQPSGEPESSSSPPQEGEPAGAPQPAPAGGDSPSEDQLAGEATTDPAALQRQLQQSVWGHLPDRVRQQLQAAMPDEFHPRYKRAITDYFRELTQAGTAP